MKTFKGFVSAELIGIVVTIQLLFYVVIPAYDDYVKKIKVDEAVELLKTGIREYIALNGQGRTEVVLPENDAKENTTNLRISSSSNSYTVASIGFKTEDDPELAVYNLSICFSVETGDEYCDYNRCPENTFPPQYLPSICKE